MKFIENFKARAIFPLHTHEVLRVLLAALVIVLCFYPDWGALRTTSFISGVFISVALISHFTRKYVLFPYIDLRVFVEKAKEDPLASSVVFASVCGVIIVSISTAATFFAR